MKIRLAILAAFAALLASCEGSGELGDPVEAGDVQAGDVQATGPVTATGAITATGEIAAGPVTAGAVQADEVTAGDVSATGQVTATGEILAGDVSAGAVSAGPVTAGLVSAGAVSAGDVTAGDVTATGTVEVSGDVTVTAGAGLGIPSGDLDIVQTQQCVTASQCDFSLPATDANSITTALEDAIAQACGGVGGTLEQVLPIWTPGGNNMTMMAVVRCP